MLKNLFNSVKSIGSSFISRIGSAFSNVGSRASSFVKSILPKPAEPIDQGWHDMNPRKPLPPMSTLSPEQFAQKYNASTKEQNLGYADFKPQIYRPKKQADGLPKKMKSLKLWNQ